MISPVSLTFSSPAHGRSRSPLAKQSFDLPFERRSSGESNTPERPRAIALKLIQPNDPSEQYPGIDPFDEIKSLSKTAGVDIVGEIWQRRRTPHAATYAGKGKLEELTELAEELSAKIVVLDDPVSPSQGKNIEERTELRVIDRAELIMDIFAQHARSHQAKLQVELAQLRYSQSRLKRMWTHLSRMEGGIGMRGPGETQLETDRRIIRKKIGLLKEKLGEIERQHETQNKSRQSAFRVALVGYTNAGKSTLMRRLTGADVLVEDRLFSTLDTSTRKWDLDGAKDVLLSDTVGFIRKLPHTLVASFHATLAEAREADLILHVVDGSSAQAENDIEVVETTLSAVECEAAPRLLILNKVDQLPDGREIDLHHVASEHDDAYIVSAVRGDGIDALIAHVQDLVVAQEVLLEYHLPLHRGDIAHRLRALSSLEEETYLEDYILLKARLLPEDRVRFEQVLVKEGLSDAAIDGLVSPKREA